MSTLAVALGLATALGVLTLVWVAIVRLGLRISTRSFGAVASLVGIVLALGFAGQGVLDLQTVRLVQTTRTAWLGGGFPTIGVFPNWQCLGAQAILVAGLLVGLAFSWIATQRDALR